MNEDQAQEGRELAETHDAAGPLDRIRPETVEVVARALDLAGEERRAHLREAAGADEERYAELVRLVHWSELDPLAHTDAGAGDAEHVAELDAVRRRADAWERIRAHLEALGIRPQALELGDTIARGGMGRIQEAWDPVLQRTVAVKSIRPDLLALSADLGEAQHAALLRFVNEARITGRLDHPGIVPVHALGLDPDGRAFFVMRRVQGHDLATIFESVRAGDADWTPTRALGVLQRVCEAMAYAHDKGVVHRDLKPANVMVGRFGEVQVMDWGVARVLESDPSSLYDTDRIEAEDLAGTAPGDTPLVTREGDVIGTPAYMSPEQAEGARASLGPRSDVYALGAMLYELLAGHPPYADDELPAHALLHRILHAPPRALEELAADAPPELVAICNRAMARDPLARYADMGAMAADLTAYLEDRVVQAHRVGAWAELRKWVRRNTLAAGALAATAFVVVASTVTIAWRENVRALEEQREADLLLARSLPGSARELGIADVDGARHAAWLRTAQGLLRRTADFEEELARLRAGGAPTEDDASGRFARAQARERDLRAFLADRARLRADLADRTGDDAYREPDHALLQETDARLEAELAVLTEKLEILQPYRFTDADRQARHDALVMALDDLYDLDREGGWIERVERQAEALATRRASVADEASLWDEVFESLSDRDGAEARPVLEAIRREGLLVPLRQDPDSRRWEFWHPLSGAEPVRDAGGGWQIEAETAIVFVLLPGGDFLLGDATDPDDGDRHAEARVALDPFLISKYELTQGQWARLSGAWPSQLFRGGHFTGDVLIQPGHPVERVSWSDCAEQLPLWGLGLPTEAQWEYAARGGIRRARWCEDQEGWQARVNFRTERESEFAVDPFRYHAPVGSLPANPFGLHDVLGNVREWTRDWNCGSFDEVEFRAGDALQVSGYSRFKVCRGGSWRWDWETIRVTRREHYALDYAENDVGVRPVILLPEALRAGRADLR